MLLQALRLAVEYAQEVDTERGWTFATGCGLIDTVSDVDEQFRLQVCRSRGRGDRSETAMPLVIDNPELEALLEEEAAKAGRDPGEYTRDLASSLSRLFRSHDSEAIGKTAFLRQMVGQWSQVKSQEDLLNTLNVSDTVKEFLALVGEEIVSALRYLPAENIERARELASDPEYLLSLPLEKRHRIMAAQAAAMAPLY